MTALSDLAPRWPEINALLDQALALSPAERVQWLDTLQVEPQGLRDTLRELLAAHAQVETSDFLDTLPRLARAAEAAALAGEPATGDAVGPYRLLRELGRGGMGAVWLAERADGQLKRPVALKLPRLAWGGALAERLARERDILASLAHPHIARLYDAGVDAIGRPWLAIEYVEGRPIDVHARELGLDTRARVRLLLDVAAAVAHAHGQQVLHRDLKPSNILVTADGQVRLLDFGIAKLMQDNSAAETALTHALGRALTPEYASPEQVRGEALSAASDVYSLGVVAYELLSGSKPYRLKRGSAAELEEAIVSADPPAASTSAADVASARALRGDLDAILNHALRKEPARRYASVDALAADLRSHLQGHRVQARPDSLWYRATRLWRAHAVLISLTAAALLAIGAALGLGAAALLIVALSTGLGATLWQARRAFAQARATAREAGRADAVQKFLIDLLGSAGFGVMSAEQRRGRTVEQMLDQAAQRLRDQPSADPQVQEALLAVVGRLLRGLGAHARAIALLRELARRLDARGAPGLERARVHGEIASALIMSDDTRPGIESFQRALAALDDLDDTPAMIERACLQCRLGLAQYVMGQPEEGSRSIEAAIVLPHWQQGNAVQRSDVLKALCSYHARLGQIEQAEIYLRRAVEADAEGRDGLDPVAIDNRTDLARLLASEQRWDESEAAFRAVLGLYESAGEPAHPMAVRISLEFVKPLALTGRVDEALEMLQRFVAAMDRNPEQYAQSLRHHVAQARFDLLIDQGRYDEAAPLLPGVEAMCATPEPAEGTIAMVVKARFLADTGRFDEALALLQHALAMRTAVFGPWHRLTLTVQNRIAGVLIASGQCDPAIAMLDDLLARAPARPPSAPYGTQHDVAQGLRDQCRLEAGQFDEALASTEGHLQHLGELPPKHRPALTEIALRLRAARCLLGLQRVDEARPHLDALEARLHPLQPQHPMRILVDGVFAQALFQEGRADEARQRLHRAERVLAAQPRLGPQFAQTLRDASRQPRPDPIRARSLSDRPGRG